MKVLVPMSAPTGSIAVKSSESKGSRWSDKSHHGTWISFYLRIFRMNSAIPQN